MGLGSSGLADVIITPFLHDTEHIFTTDRKEDKAPQSGRLFATFRHPVARAVSLFKYLQYADWVSFITEVYDTVLVNKTNKFSTF